MAFRVISFYRYTYLPSPESLRDELRAFCKKHQIVGRILLAEEGVNGAVSGLDDDVSLFQNLLKSKFKGLTFRERPSHTQAYHKLVVRVRKEICAFDTPVDVRNHGEYVSAEKLHQMYETGEKFRIIDARNEYEAEVGKFENAEVLPIDSFREFSKAVDNMDASKEEQIVLYCTGGIRCEKATAYMKEQGYQNVKHLKGGIINYLNKYPGEHYEGGCFVFDDRLLDQADNIITQCVHCGTKSAHMTNCHNLECDKLYITCESCAEKTKHNCSSKCQQNPRQRAEKRFDPIIGTVQNYYEKAGVALVRVTKEVKPGYKLRIEGNATQNVEVVVKEMRDYDENPIDHAEKNQLITLPVREKVRKNDCVRLVYA